MRCIWNQQTASYKQLTIQEIMNGIFDDVMGGSYTRSEVVFVSSHPIFLHDQNICPQNFNSQILQLSHTWKDFSQDPSILGM